MLILHLVFNLNFASHSNFGIACEASKTDIVYTIVAVNCILR